MENQTVENYVKAIYQACAENRSETATTGDIARRLAVTPGSVTAMLQRLDETDLVKYQTHRGVRLTDQGTQLALRVLRRHRLIELFLSKTLGMSWDEIHEEAERIEHAASDRLVDRIDHFLGRPKSDPHGDPIPNADGTLRTDRGEPLSECLGNTRFVLQRVLDQSPDFLRYLSQGGFAVGQIATVLENHPSAGVVTVDTGGQQISLSREHAANLLVERL